MKALGLYHITLMTPDYEASKAFYLGMGCRVVAEWTEALVAGQPAQFSGVLLNMGNGSHVELSPTKVNWGDEQYPLLRHFSLQVDDARAAYSFALQNGARRHQVHPQWDGSPREVQVAQLKMLVSFVRGPGGETLELLQRLESSSPPVDQLG